MTSKQNSRQVGGNHYKEDETAVNAIQHWDLMWMLHGENYFRGQMSKYVERFRRKNGKQDLEKSLQYIDKLLELFASYPEIDIDPCNYYAWDESRINDFINMRQRTIAEKHILLSMLTFDSIEELNCTRNTLEQLIETEYGGDATPEYVNQDKEETEETLKMFKMFPDVNLPVYAKQGDAGMDIQAYTKLDDAEYEIFLHPGERKLIPTGLKVGIPEGMMIQICSRSGLAAKNGVISLISPGIIDSGYRGELKVCLYNSGIEGFVVKHGDRVAQLILQHTPKLPMCEVTSEEHLGASERGVGGFGSTGV